MACTRSVDRRVREWRKSAPSGRGRVESAMGLFSVFADGSVFTDGRTPPPLENWCSAQFLLDQRDADA